MHAMQGVKPAKARTETAKLIRACAKTVQSAECKVLHLECGYQATEFLGNAGALPFGKTICRRGFYRFFSPECWQDG